jgi:hypothetical protein
VTSNGPFTADSDRAFSRRARKHALKEELGVRRSLLPRSPGDYELVVRSETERLARTAKSLSALGFAAVKTVVARPAFAVVLVRATVEVVVANAAVEACLLLQGLPGFRPETVLDRCRRLIGG